LESPFRHPADSFAFERVFQVTVLHLDVHRQLPLLLEVMKRVFERRAEIAGIETQSAR
jgi:hypothetical protein